MAYIAATIEGIVCFEVLKEAMYNKPILNRVDYV
jgi:hypothetical protein